MMSQLYQQKAIENSNVSQQCRIGGAYLRVFLFFHCYPRCSRNVGKMFSCTCYLLANFLVFLSQFFSMPEKSTLVMRRV